MFGSSRQYNIKLYHLPNPNAMAALDFAAETKESRLLRHVLTLHETEDYFVFDPSSDFPHRPGLANQQTLLAFRPRIAALTTEGLHASEPAGRRCRGNTLPLALLAAACPCFSANASLHAPW